MSKFNVGDLVEVVYSSSFVDVGTIITVEESGYYVKGIDQFGSHKTVRAEFCRPCTTPDDKTAKYDALLEVATRIVERSRTVIYGGGLVRTIGDGYFEDLRCAVDKLTPKSTEQLLQERLDAADVFASAFCDQITPPHVFNKAGRDYRKAKAAHEASKEHGNG